MARTAFTPGFIYGDFYVRELLGKGAMAEVYLATDHRNGIDVALKVLTHGFDGAEARVQRFEREARAIAAVSHPNVVAVYEVGKLNRTPFIAMDYVTGPTLRECLEGGALAPLDAIDIARQIADGLAAAHRSGIVHRDLKPENIIIASDGTVKILDFGLSKPLAHGSDDELTLPGTILGTLEYMSPEQASGEPVDYRADQFALGAILYEMLSGRGAFRGDCAARVLASVSADEPEPLGNDVPAELREIATRALSKRPGARFASMEDLGVALNNARPAWDRGRSTMLAVCGVVLALLGGAFCI